MVVGFRMVSRQPHVLIHIEGLDILETDFSSLVVLHKFGVHFQRGAACKRNIFLKNSEMIRKVLRTCGQAKDKVLVLVGLELIDSLDHILGRPVADQAIFFQNDQPHDSTTSDKELISPPLKKHERACIKKPVFDNLDTIALFKKI